jgi:hypothetical protein
LEERLTLVQCIEIYFMAKQDEQYKLIPLMEIDPEAQKIAVAWVENYVPNGSIYPEIAQVHKLASDIMNYNLSKRKGWMETIERLTGKVIELTGENKRLKSDLLERDAIWLPAKDAEIEKLQNELRNAKK